MPASDAQTVMLPFLDDDSEAVLAVEFDQLHAKLRALVKHPTNDCGRCRSLSEAASFIFVLQRETGMGHT